MKKRMLTFLLAMSFSIPFFAMPAYATENKMTKLNENFILINPKSLEIQKTSKGTTYWKVTPQRFVTAMNSLFEFTKATDNIPYTPVQDLTKTKDKNIFTYKNKNVTLSFYTLGNSYSDSYIYKIVIQMDHRYTMKEKDFSIFYDLVTCGIGVFTTADLSDSTRIIDSIDYDSDGGIITNKTVQYEFRFDDENTSVTMTPYQKTAQGK